MPFGLTEDVRDVFLEDFADTDDEIELNEDEEERQIRREERREVGCLAILQVGYHG